MSKFKMKSFTCGIWENDNSSLLAQFLGKPVNSALTCTDREGI